MSEQAACLGLGLTDETVRLVEQRQRLLGCVAAGGSLGEEARETLRQVNIQLGKAGLLAGGADPGDCWQETDLYMAALAELFSRGMAEASRP